MLVTFNYDTLLESALQSYYGANFGVIADYISHKQFKLFKLHGSTDWGHTWDVAPAGSALTPATIIAQAAQISPSTNIVTHASYRGGPPLYPAIAIPVAKKGVFECPDEHIQQLTAFLPRVTKILAIGWRGTEDHFLGLLRRAGGGNGIKIVTVAGNGDEANETLHRLRALALPVAYSAVYAGFSQVITGRLTDGFLASDP